MEYKKYSMTNVGKLSPAPVFVNTVLLEHSYVYLFACC